MFLPHVKICGITRRQDALFCAQAGAGAVGVVFHGKSPRHVSPTQARYLFEDLPAQVARVGVFVDVSAEIMVDTARAAALDTVQMHGVETLESIRAVLQAGFHVVKVLRRLEQELVAEARALPPQAGILVECGSGVLPGGNGVAWDWSAAAALAEIRPFAIAGGLNPGNLAEAARASHAAGFDASSNLESAPGLKDEAAVRAFLRAAAELPARPMPFSWKGIP
jgi:phosphoribosylanthranilate isomerase